MAFGVGCRPWHLRKLRIRRRSTWSIWRSWNSQPISKSNLKNGRWPACYSTAFPSLLLAGVRSSAATARQLVYEAEGLVVDLRFDRLIPSGMVSAVGQILDKRVPRELLGGSAVVVWTDDGQLIATTEANGFGEFQLEFAPQDRLRLTARVGRRRVHIPLTNLK